MVLHFTTADAQHLLSVARVTSFGGKNRGQGGKMGSWGQPGGDRECLHAGMTGHRAVAGADLDCRTGRTCDSQHSAAEHYF